MIRKLPPFFIAAALICALCAACGSGAPQTPPDTTPRVYLYPPGDSGEGPTGTLPPTGDETNGGAANPVGPSNGGNPANGNISSVADAGGGGAVAGGSSVVYMTADISPEGLMSVYRALGARPMGKVAVKVHTGEPPNSNYLRPELIRDLVRSVSGTIVETNAVAGSRASSAMHLQVAKDHGFTSIAAFELLDMDGEISLPVSGGEVLSENFVGASFPNYDYYIVLSHFKGHQIAGYGGALKNLSIGMASAAGKSWIHSGGTRRSGYSGSQDIFLKAMAEAGKSVADSLDGNLLFINVMNRLSVDCDCNGNPAEPDMHDIGILASLDPVALDRACVDLVIAAPDGQSLVNRVNSRNGQLTMEHAAKIGLGSLTYALVNIDD